MPDAAMRFDSLTHEQQEFIVEYLQDNFLPTGAINQRHSAYGLKQKFSREYFYVTQEQFTEAMVRAGFQASPLKKSNARFNASERSPYFKKSSC